MTRILVTDGEQRSTLAVVRSLGRTGHNVSVCSLDGRSLAGASRHAVRDRVVRDPLTSTSGFLDDVAEVIRDYSVEMFVPMTDAAASVALGLRERSPGLIIPFPEEGVWAAAADKAALVELGRSLGVPVPSQHVVAEKSLDFRAAAMWAATSGYPVVMKPHRTAIPTEGRVETVSVQLVRDEDALITALRNLPGSAFPALVQERICGPGLGAFFLVDRGEVLASFAHERIREKPPTGGVSVLRESVPLRTDVREHSESILRALSWSGVAMVEFKEDSATGLAYLMEINGRFWGSVQLAIDSGVDFPNLLVSLYSLEETGRSMRPPAQPGYRVGVRSRWLWGDVDHLLAVLRDADSSLGSKIRASVAFLRPWNRRQRFEVAQLTDLKPFFRESIQWLKGVMYR